MLSLVPSGLHRGLHHNEQHILVILPGLCIAAVFTSRQISEFETIHLFCSPLPLYLLVNCSYWDTTGKNHHIAAVLITWENNNLLFSILQVNNICLLCSTLTVIQLCFTIVHIVSN